MAEIVRSSVAETRNGLLGARSSRLASVVRFHTMARTKENAAHPSRAFGASRVSASVGPSCARAVLSMSHSEANDAPFRVEVKPDRHWYFVGLEHGIPCSHGFVGEQIRLFFAPSFASRNANADEKLSLSHRAETTLRDAFGCRPLQGVAPPYGRLGQSSRATIGSRRFHPLRRATYRSDGSMLLTMRAPSACPLPIPKCRSAVVTTPSAAPAAFTMVYSDVIGCESVSVTTVVGNLDGGILAAAVRAREWNDGGAISRNRAPATTFEVVDSDEIGDVHGRSRLARRSSVSAGGGAEEQIEAVHPDFDEAL